MMTRRSILFGGVAIMSSLGWRFGHAGQQTETFEVTHTAAEWRQLLAEPRYAVLRAADTERPGSSPLNAEKRKGLFHCAGCDLPVYSSQMKFESGTGWPSFWDSVVDAVRLREDTGYFMTRTEVHCRRCGGHFGHVFNDGPPPTGKRHCINGLALYFHAGEGTSS